MNNQENLFGGKLIIKNIKKKWHKKYQTRLLIIWVRQINYNAQPGKAFNFYLWKSQKTK